MSYCIYRHIRPDTNEVFYVGMGTQKRSTATVSRNRFWHRVVNKNNGKYAIHIMLDGLTKQEAEKKEIEFIELYGRRFKGGGTLTNIHLGGNHHSDFNMSEVTKINMSKSHKGNTATKNYIRINNGFIIKAIHKDSIIPEGWKRGEPYNNNRRHSEETKRKMSLTKKGNPMPFTTEQRRLWSKNNKSALGCYWVNNGVISKLLKPDEIIPEGYFKGRIRTWINQYGK